MLTQRLLLRSLKGIDFGGRLVKNGPSRLLSQGKKPFQADDNVPRKSARRPALNPKGDPDDCTLSPYPEVSPLRPRPLLLLAALSLQAPSSGITRRRTQPTASSSPFGDSRQYYNWLHDKSGYTISSHRQRYLSTAPQENGRLVSSGMIVTANDVVNQAGVLASPAAGPQVARSPAEARGSCPQGSPPPSGNPPVPHPGPMTPCVFIRFAGEAEFHRPHLGLPTPCSTYHPRRQLDAQLFRRQVSYNTLTMPTSLSAPMTPRFYRTATTEYFHRMDPSPIRGYPADSQRTTREHTSSRTRSTRGPIPAG